MSAALVEPVVEIPRAGIESPKVIPAHTPAELIEKKDPHPLVPVFIIGGMALIGTFAFVGSIVLWLLLRHTGVMAP